MFALLTLALGFRYCFALNRTRVNTLYVFEVSRSQWAQHGKLRKQGNPSSITFRRSSCASPQIIICGNFLMTNRRIAFQVFNQRTLSARDAQRMAILRVRRNIEKNGFDLISVAVLKHEQSVNRSGTRRTYATQKDERKVDIFVNCVECKTYHLTATVQVIDCSSAVDI